MDSISNFCRTYWSKILLVILVFGLRIPSYFEPFWYGDENIYASIGFSLRHGLMLYRDVFDHKPPLIYWVTAATTSLLMMKLVLSTAVASSLLIVSAIAGKLFKSRWIRIIITGLFLLFTTLPAFEGNIFNAELLFMPFGLAGMWCLLSFTRTNLYLPKTYLYLLLSGICFGIAVGFKIPAAVEFLAGGLFLHRFFSINQVPIKYRLTRFLIYLAGFLTPLLTIMLILATMGIVKEFIAYGVLYNSRYVSDWAGVTQSPLINFLAPWWVRVGILTAGIILIFKSKLSLELQWVLSWTLLVIFGILLSLRPYPHYFLQVVPASCLLVGWLLSSKWRYRLAAGLMLIVLGLLVHYLPVTTFRTLGYYQVFGQYARHQIDWNEYASWLNSGVPERYYLAEWIFRHKADSQTLFVWGNIPELYRLTGLLPQSNYLTDYHINSINGYQDTLMQLNKHLPNLIVDCHRNPASFPGLYQLLDHYSNQLQTESCDVYLKNP